MLEARELSFSRGARCVLEHVSLSAQAGELTMIIGPNGAGKSTLLGLLSGYLRPSGGSVRINGLTPQRATARQLARVRAVVEQQPGWQAGLTVSELVLMGAYLSPGGQHYCRQAMRLAQCEPWAERRLESLSGGERQRAHLARALLQLLCSSETQRFLLLDEPTAALDFGVADALMAQIRQLAQSLSLGVVAVVHDINLALRHADRVLLMADGRGAAFGLPAEVMQKSRLEALYGVRLAELVSADELIRAFVPLQAE